MNEKRHHMSDVRLHPQAVNCEEDATVNMERSVTEEIEMSPIGAAHEANKKDTIVNMEPDVAEETEAHSSGPTCEVGEAVNLLRFFFFNNQSIHL